MSHATHFKVIVITIINFYFSSSLMGMESWFSSSKKADQGNQNYNSKKLKGLLSFRNADITDKYGILLPKDIKDIIAKYEYLLIIHSKSSHYKALDLDDITKLRYGLDNNKDNSRDLIFDYNLTCLNDKDRIQQYKGSKIVSTDFDLMTINNEGNAALERLLIAMPRKNKNGIFAHPYAHNSVSDIKYLKDSAKDINKLKHLDKKFRKEPKLDGFYRHSLLLPHEYNTILKLPLNLRRKVGDSVTVKVIGEEQIPFDIKRNNVCIGAAIAFIPCFLAGVSELKNINSLEEIKGFCYITAINTTIGAISGVINTYTGIDPDKIVYNVVEKPLFTLEEQNTIKKAKIGKISSNEDKSYNDELTFLLQHRQMMDDDWKNRSEKDKELNQEIFRQNRNAVEQEIKSLKKNRMIFMHSNMKNSDFEDVQTERNAAHIQKIWNNSPLHTNNIHCLNPSQLNPDVKTFNSFQQKHILRKESKKSQLIANRE